MSNPYEPAQPSSEPPQPAAPAAGWYPDPSGDGSTRWWDGTAWTEHVTPAAPVAPPAAQAAPAAGFPAAEAAPAYPPAYAATPAYAAAPGYAPAYQGGYAAPRRVGFGEAVRRAFAGWSDYSGRATVAEYWWFVLFQALIGIPLYILFLVSFASTFSTTTSADGTPVVSSDGMTGLGILLLVVLLVVYAVFFVVGLALSVRRLHDTDKSGWWYLIAFVPFGSIVLLVFFVMAGTPGPNRYGPIPQ